MKRFLFCACALSVTLTTQGYASSKDSFVMKETFRNNYGIIVSKQDWKQRGCDGTITKVFKDGSIRHEVYVQNVLHGEVSQTFPHSTTIASLQMYDQGRLVSHKIFLPNGLPSKEEVFQEDGTFTVTRWPDNKENNAITEPYFIETVYHGRIIEGQYCSFNGKYRYAIHEGEGVRPTFSSNNVLLSEETFSNGELVKQTTFYSNRDPETITYYQNQIPHGFRFTYLPGGIPNTIEEWRYGYQDGTTVFFKNGCKIAEVPFVKGIKEGLELRYNEQETIAEEVSWKNNHLHGMKKIYAAGECKCEWYYRGKAVSKTKFERLNSAAIS